MKAKLRPWQTKFILSPIKYSALVAAWGTGKSMSLIAKGMDLSEFYANNLGVIFRKQWVDLRDSTMMDFERYTGLKIDSQRNVILENGSTIMFRHLEELNNIQNINLGWFGIEQAEELESDNEFFTLWGRLRRENTSLQGFIVANTKGSNWIKRVFKDEGIKDEKGNCLSELIEATTYDNAENLPKAYLDSLEVLKIQKPEKYNRFVMNSWEDILEEQVFDIDILNQWETAFKDVWSMDCNIVEEDGIYSLSEAKTGIFKVFEKVDPKKSYRIGADVAEGIMEEDLDRDYSAACVLDAKTQKQVAKIKIRCKPDIFADYLNLLGRYYNNALLGVEANNHGHAVLAILQREHKYPNIYYKETLDEKTQVKTKKFGWYTNPNTKPLMINTHSEYLRQNKTILVDKETIKEHKEFIQDEDGQYRGRAGFHDDEVMACAIASMMCKLKPWIDTGIDWSKKQFNRSSERKTWRDRQFRQQQTHNRLMRRVVI